MTGRLAAALVSAQFSLLLILVLWPSEAPDSWLVRVPSWFLLALGIAIVAGAAPTLGRALTVSPIPKQGAGLRSTGLYGWVRHPMYTGVLLAGSGLALRGWAWVHVAAVLSLDAVLIIKIRFEEAHLMQAYPDYPAYQRRVGAVLPRPERALRLWRRQNE